MLSASDSECTGIINEYSLQAKYSNHVFTLKITNFETMEEFEMVIDQNKISSDPIHQMFFNTPLLLFHQICQRIQKKTLTIYKNGEIQFVIIIQMESSLRNYKIVLQSVKKETTNDQLLEKRIAKLQFQLKVEKKKNEEKSAQFAQFKESTLKTLNQSKQQLIKFKNQFTSYKEAQIKITTELQNKNTYLEQSFSQYQKMFAQAKRELNDLKLDYDHLTANKFRINESNPHNCKFELLGNKIKKIADNKRWQAIIGRKLSLNSKFSFKARQSQGNQLHNIMYGIATATIKGTSAYDQIEAISYYANNGDVFAYGDIQKSEGGAIKKGQVIELRVNTTTWIVEWFKNRVKLVQCPIPSHLREKQLYQVIWLYHMQDQIELL